MARSSFQTNILQGTTAVSVSPGASVEVRRVIDGVLVQLYDARNGGNSIGNPATADAEGWVFFFVEAGIYNITITNGTDVRTLSRFAVVDEDSVSGVLAAQVDSIISQGGVGYFADTTAGLAATEDGDYFIVIEDDPVVATSLYLNDGGVAVLQVQFPNASAVQEVLDNIQTAIDAADTATTQAGVATTQAGIATTQAGIATNAAGVAVDAADAAGDSEIAAEDSADTATTQAGIATGAAGTATTQAGIATTQAGLADDARVLAQAAASAATTQAGVATTQAGLAVDARNEAEGFRDEVQDVVELGEFKVVSGTSYNVIADDFGKMLLFTNNSAVSVSVAHALGDQFRFEGIQGGDGAVTVNFSGNPNPPVSMGGATTTSEKGAPFGVGRSGTNWYLWGALV